MGYANDVVGASAQAVNRPTFGVIDGSGQPKAQRRRRIKRPGPETVGKRPLPVEVFEENPVKIYADEMMRQGTWRASNPSEGSAAAGSSGIMVHHWNGLHWEHVGGEDGIAHAAEWLDGRFPLKANPQRASSMWNWLSLRLRSQFKMPKGDPNAAVIPCKDAYLVLTKDGIKAIAPDPDMGVCYATRIKCGTEHGKDHELSKFDPNSMFGRYLCHAQPDPAVRAYIQEQCGMCLLPGNYSHAIWWYGMAGSGKSTLANLVQSCLSSVAAVRLSDLGERFGLEPILGAQLVRVEEVEVGEKWSEGKFKALASGDPVPADRKNEKAIPAYRSQSKWIVTSNPEPFIRDKSDGVMRRLGIVHWAHKINGAEDKDFAEKLLEAEGRQFLDWMLEGALRVIQRGRMLSVQDEDMPKATALLRDRIRDNNDNIRAWVSEEKVQRVPGLWRTTASIYERYCAWCVAVDLDPVDKHILIRSLSQMAPVGLGERSNRRINGGKPTRCYELGWVDMTYSDERPRFGSCLDLGLPKDGCTHVSTCGCPKCVEKRKIQMDSIPGWDDDA